jgi:hypothetical protein
MHAENKKRNESVDSIKPNACKYAVKERENIFSSKKEYQLCPISKYRYGSGQCARRTSMPSG